MRVLVACEYSGVVREAFNSMGHDAWSCDLLDTEQPGNHLIGDVSQYINDGDWDLMIAHPPCTFLSVSGMHWTTRGFRDPALTEEALDFVRLLLAAPIPKIALENPVSVINTRIRKPDQTIHPWMFGDNASKRTCLWMKGLPNLQVADRRLIYAPAGWGLIHEEVDGEWCWLHEGSTEYCGCLSAQQARVPKKIDGFWFGCKHEDAPKPRWANQTPGGQNKLGPSEDRWKERSRTFSGIAKAMAAQWGGQ